MDPGQLTLNKIRVAFESKKFQMDHSKRKKTVCLHWMNGQCKKGAACEFLHAFEQEKMPICQQFLQDGNCLKGENCMLKHVSPNEKRGKEACPYYERGFCKHGSACEFRHDRLKICEDYAFGFCPLGPNCTKYHFKNLVQDISSNLHILANFPEDNNWSDKKVSQQQNRSMQQMDKVRCHRCGRENHKSTYCMEPPIGREEL